MISHWNILDFVIIFTVVISILFGIIKGLVRGVLSFIFLILGIVFAILYYQDLGDWLGKYIDNPDIANFCGFITILVLLLIAGSLLSYTVKKLIVRGPLKSIDRILGSVFGLIRGVILAAVIIFALILFPVKGELVRGSVLSPIVLETMEVILSFLPEKHRETIDIFKFDEQKTNSRVSRKI